MAKRNDPLDIIARLGEDHPNPPTDAELKTAVEDLKEALDVATSSDEPDLDLAKDLRAALDTVRSAQDEREQAREASRTEAKKLREGIFDEDEETEEETEEVEEPEAEEKQPVAASATSIIERLKMHAATKASAEPETPKITSGVTVKAIGPASGYDIGDGDFRDLGQMFSTHAKSVMGDGRSEKLFRLTREYPEERRLGFNVEINNRRITDVFGFGGTSRPVTAAGGLCGPGDVDHSHPVCSERGRPVRDSLAQFNAARGQVTFSPSMSIGDLEANVSIWTSETDSAPGTATKPCPPLACPEELNCAVDAVVRCVTIGNFQANFSPEFWAASLETLLAAFDRVAEQKVIEEIDLASTNVPGVNEGNTLNSFLAGVNNIISSDRAAHRNLTGGYVVVADAYVRDQIRNQIIKNLGVANNIEALQIADSQIDGWLSDVGARAVWTYDGTFDSVAGTHRLLTPGQVPTEAGVYVYPEDAFLFLDGGTLDLGTQITDSTLNATNDRQAFAESFEKTCFRGCSAYKFEFPIADFCGCNP